MSLYIQSNNASLVAQQNLQTTETQLSKSFQSLSSGYRINSAADDAAGLGIATSMKAQVASYAVAQRNANDGISMAQTADGAASQIADMLSNLRALAVQGSTGTLSANDSTNLNTEFQSTLNEINRVANVAQFNGKNLLAGTAANTSFQVGIGTTANDQVSVSFGGADVAGLALTGSAVDSTTNSQAAITSLDTAIQSLTTIREGFGAGMVRMQSAVSNLQSTQTNMSAALSQIQDVDVATATSALARQQVLAQAGASVLSQANQQPQLALKLLQ